MSSPLTPPLKANVVGLGLIGGSVALALHATGYLVGATDFHIGTVDDALARGIIDNDGLYVDAVVTFVATPVGTIVETVLDVLSTTSGIVTDVGSVKAKIASAVSDPRFIPGHPMAGSELDGLDGADPHMFESAVWILTPTPFSSDNAVALVAGMVSSFGSEVVALTPEQHDDLVAVVSHVPHLVAATLMALADDRSEEHLALLRMAAGGFRDMTRIASGRPSIWLDICEQNKDSIVRGLSALINGLEDIREVVLHSQREELFAKLERARIARINLPSRAGDVEDLSEVRIPIPDRPGAAADVFTLSGELGVNIYDFEIVHSVEGDRGIMVTIVRAEHAEMFRGGLLARGFRPAISPL